MRMQGWGVKTIAGLGMLAGWFLACAGEDIPPIDDELRGALAEGFGGADTQMGSAGSAGSGSGGRGGSGSSGSGNAGRGGSASTGGSASSGGGAAGSGGEPVGGGGDTCDAFPILERSCGLSGCHSEGVAQGAFAASEDTVADFVDLPSTKGASCDGVFIDSANPEESLIYTRLNDPGCGQLTMPLAGDPLTEEEQECLLSWLEGFAE